jgi:hypothetical protein
LYFDRQSAAKTLRAELPAVQSDLSTLTQNLRNAIAEDHGSPTVHKLNDCCAAVKPVARDISAAITGFEDDSKPPDPANGSTGISRAKGALTSLLKGFSGSPPAGPIPPHVSAFQDCLATLIPLLRSDQATRPTLGQIADQISTLTDKLSTNFEQFNEQYDEASLSAQKEADKVTIYAQSAIDRLFDRTDFSSVGPVVTFDVARLWNGSGVGTLPVRYAPGGGVRLKLFNVINLTAVYGFNPVRNKGESAGAFGVTLTVTNWLR